LRKQRWLCKFPNKLAWLISILQALLAANSIKMLVVLYAHIMIGQMCKFFCGSITYRSQELDEIAARQSLQPCHFAWQKALA
jgi:hypothetical protein